MNRVSAAEYLTFVAAGGQSETSVEMRYENENIWLPQKMMATVYDVAVPAINQHLKRVFADNELEEAAVIKQYLTTAADGKNYQVKRRWAMTRPPARQNAFLRQFRTSCITPFTAKQRQKSLWIGPITRRKNPQI